MSVSVELIREISKDAGTPFVPPVSDYEVRSDSWVLASASATSSRGGQLGQTHGGQPSTAVLIISVGASIPHCIALTKLVALVA